MNIFCRVFGHKPPVYGAKGWWSPGEEYGYIRAQGIDHIGRMHCTVYAECPRCKTEFKIARTHIPLEIAQAKVQWHSKNETTPP